MNIEQIENEVKNDENENKLNNEFIDLRVILSE